MNSTATAPFAAKLVAQFDAKLEPRNLADETSADVMRAHLAEVDKIGPLPAGLRVESVKAYDKGGVFVIFKAGPSGQVVLNSDHRHPTLTFARNFPDDYDFYRWPTASATFYALQRLGRMNGEYTEC